MQTEDRHFELRLARSERDLLAAQRLRYVVFVSELGATGPTVHHDSGLEADAYDPLYDHLLLIDTRREAAGQDHVVGVYRLLRSEVAARVGGFYSSSEYDLTALEATGRRLLELGRSCVHPEYRGGAAMFHLWNGLSEYVRKHQIEILFGVASFHGTDVASLAQPLSYLHYNHLAPPDMRVRALGEHRVAMDLLPEAEVDRKLAMVQTPALIKAYIRLGGFVGDGAFVDSDFNTTDVFLLMDTARMSSRHRSFYVRPRGGVQ